MLRSMRLMLWLVLVITGLTACTSKYSTNGENLYLKSRNGPNLVVPPPLSTSNLSSFYRLPDQSNPNPRVSILPPTITTS